MSHDLPVEPERLLVHGPRLRALARRLVHDDSLAEDLVQETWVRALERGPGAARSLQRWLATVLRNLAFQGRRLEARRVQRERAVARSEAKEEHEERFSGHKELVAAIDRLGEPYRQAILLRYFEDQSPRKIAARLGIPVKTVKTRLNRGLAVLREDLDRRHGGRELWLAALVPLLRRGPVWPFPSLPVAQVLLMKNMIAIASLAVLVAAGVYLMLQAKRGEPAEAAEPTPVLAGEERPQSEPGLPSTEASEARTAVPSTVPVTTSPPGPAPAPDSARRRGRVLDPNGKGLAGVMVGFDVKSDPQPVLSGEDGGFELADLDRAVVSLDEGFATVLASRLDPQRAMHGDEHVVVVAPAVTLGGIVVDDHGAPVAGATVRIEIPLSFRGRFREVLDGCHEQWWIDRTDEQGRFLLPRAPGITSARLVARPGDDRTARVPVPDHDEMDLELVLTVPSVPDSAPDPDAVHVVGEVRHADGRPAQLAMVSLDGACTRADEEALFELFAPQASDSGSGRQLLAVLPGVQAASFVPARDAGGEELWPSFVTLRLGGLPQSIAGRVLEADGQPLGNALVWIEDLTYFGNTDRGFLTLEGQMEGKQGTDRPWSAVHTDGEGRFELRGLAERSYTIAAMDPATLEVAQVGPLAAGTRDVELVLAADGLLERVAGRVLDTHGHPLAGLHVEQRRVTSHLRSLSARIVGEQGQLLGTGSVWQESARGTGVLTDDSGSFELEQVPRKGIVLHVTGSSVAPVDVELDQIADPTDIRVEVPWLGHVQIELAGPAPERGRIELLGADGRPVDVYIFGGGSVWIRNAIWLELESEFTGGRTPVLSVPEVARAAVLRDAQGNELRRAPVELGEGLTTVRL